MKKNTFKLWFPKTHRNSNVHSVLSIVREAGDSVEVRRIGRTDGKTHGLGGAFWMQRKSLLANYEQRAFMDLSETGVMDNVTEDSIFRPAPGCDLPRDLLLVQPPPQPGRVSLPPPQNGDLLAEVRRTNLLLEQLLKIWAGGDS